MQRIPLEPNSLWAAKERGGPEYFGWSEDSFQLANIVDSINQNTSVTAAHGSGKRAKKVPAVYRPTDKAQVQRPKSIREMGKFKIGG